MLRSQKATGPHAPYFRILSSGRDHSINRAFGAFQVLHSTANYGLAGRADLLQVFGKHNRGIPHSCPQIFRIGVLGETKKQPDTRTSQHKKRPTQQQINLVQSIFVGHYKLNKQQQQQHCKIHKAYVISESNTEKIVNSILSQEA